MPKRKHFPRLPSGYGSVRYLGPDRRLPYAVHPPASDRTKTGRYIRPKALCYVPDWYTGFAVLSAWHAGTYKPGLELTIRKEAEQAGNLDNFCRRVMRDFSIATGTVSADMVTFSEVYEQFYDYKFGENAAKELSKASQNAFNSGFKHLEQIHDKAIGSITLEALQGIVNSCERKQATKENIVLCAKNTFRYAVAHGYCERNVAEMLIVPASDPDEHGVPFTDAELSKLWKVYRETNDSTAQFILIMCYSGFRISAYTDMETNLAEGYFFGGVKTRSSKERTVPIHPAIMPLVTDRLERYGCLLPVTPAKFRKAMYSLLEDINIEQHTPHDCRHTFSRLCKKYHVGEAERKKMMGHSFGSDITNGIYGHWSLEDLRNEIKKIEAPN